MFCPAEYFLPRAMKSLPFYLGQPTNERTRNLAGFEGVDWLALTVNCFAGIGLAFAMH